jgi:hypothetical protein
MDWDKRTFITSHSEYGEKKRKTILDTELQKTVRELAKKQAAKERSRRDLRISENRLAETILRTRAQRAELFERGRQANTQLALGVTGKVLDSLKLTGILVILGLLFVGPAIFESLHQLINSAPPIAWVVLIALLIFLRKR